MGTDNALRLESSGTSILVSGPAETACLENRMLFQVPPYVRTAVLGWTAQRGSRTPAECWQKTGSDIRPPPGPSLGCACVGIVIFLIRSWHIHQVEFSASLPPIVHSLDSFPPVSLWHWLLLRSMQ